MQPFQNCNTQLTQCLTVCEMKYFSSAGINYFLFQPAPPAPGPSSGGEPVQASPDRRCSTRLLSASVHQTLKQLQKEQYEQRVSQLVHRNKIFYRRQRICESFTAFLILVSFTGRQSISSSTVSLLCLQCSLCTWCCPTVSIISGLRSITLSRCRGARTENLETLYLWSAKLMITGSGAGEWKHYCHLPTMFSSVQLIINIFDPIK